MGVSQISVEGHDVVSGLVGTDFDACCAVLECILIGTVFMVVTCIEALMFSLQFLVNCH